MILGWVVSTRPFDTKSLTLGFSTLLINTRSDHPLPFLWSTAAHHIAMHMIGQQLSYGIIMLALVISQHERQWKDER